ncbi:hypothetical protein SAMD00019534_062220, partial [Acytostelium subglobosum LB1]|uniref:hypothetical protein n=1 Tax=Acytostelium subglobosum LB1 TaxID=1410327 RepID=UPI000644B64C
QTNNKMSNNNMVDGLSAQVMSEKYIDAILGTIYGNALGDAYGLATEFMNRQQIQQKYPDQQQLIPFPDYLANRHNHRWDKGDWTDDTDQMIVLMQMLTEKEGVVDVVNAAKRLHGWIENGFPELGDVSGMGFGQTVMAVTTHPQFMKDPIKTSKEVWIRMNRSMAANGAVMRTSILGCSSTHSKEIVLRNTIRCAQITHYDLRCIISCTTITYILAALIRMFKEDPATSITDSIIEQLVLEAKQQARELVDRLLEGDYKGEVTRELVDTQLQEYNNYVDMRQLDEMQLDC